MLVHRIYNIIMWPTIRKRLVCSQHLIYIPSGPRPHAGCSAVQKVNNSVSLLSHSYASAPCGLRVRGCATRDFAEDCPGPSPGSRIDDALLRACRPAEFFLPNANRTVALSLSLPPIPPTRLSALLSLSLSLSFSLLTRSPSLPSGRRTVQ
jgi:hypothetical protein